jgi:hypothetical protein
MPAFQIGQLVRTVSTYGQVCVGHIVAVQILKHPSGQDMPMYDIRIESFTGIAAWECDVRAP